MHLDALGTAEINVRELVEVNKSSRHREDTISAVGAEMNECLIAMDAGLRALQDTPLEAGRRIITDELASHVHKMQGGVNRLLASRDLTADPTHADEACIP